jgi:hypothetical protein
MNRFLLLGEFLATRNSRGFFREGDPGLDALAPAAEAQSLRLEPGGVELGGPRRIGLRASTSVKI